MAGTSLLAYEIVYRREGCLFMMDEGGRGFAAGAASICPLLFGSAQLFQITRVERARLFGHRGDAQADEVARLVAPALVEPDVVRGRRLHRDLAGGERYTDEHRAPLVNDAGVADVDRARDDADARLAQVARAAFETLAGDAQLRVARREVARQLGVVPRLASALLTCLLHHETDSPAARASGARTRKLVLE